MLPIRATIVRAQQAQLTVGSLSVPCGARAARRFSAQDDSGKVPGMGPRLLSALTERLASALPGPPDAEYVSPINGAPRLPSPWNKWFPYEPVPCSPQLHPYTVKCKGGEVYNWCACGECRTQPYCEDNGGPAGCRSRGFAAVQYIPQHDGTKLMCGCKQCGSAPMFNGTCWIKWADYNTGPAMAISFAGCFFFGVISTWLAHP